MDKQQFMARSGSSAHATYFIYEHHKIFAHATDVAFHFNFGSSHITFLCDSEEHMRAVLTQYIDDLTKAINNQQETNNDSD